MRKGILFRWSSCWIGWHWSPENKRLCVNLVPCITFWFVWPGGNVPAKVTNRELLELQFVRKEDRKTVDVTCIACPRCKNYCWVQDFHIEPPQFCGYCGLQFEGVRQISGEDMARIQNF